MNSHSAKSNSFQIKDRTFQYSLDIIVFLKQIDRSDFIGQTLARQLVRSATSVGANIIEAQAASSKREFANYFQIALKSANESIYWLELFKKSKILNSDKTDKLIEETSVICRIIAKSLITMRGK